MFTAERAGRAVVEYWRGAVVMAEIDTGRWMMPGDTIEVGPLRVNGVRVEVMFCPHWVPRLRIVEG